MSTITETRSSYDEYLRQFMLAIYNYTGIGIGISGVTAYLTYATGAMYAMGSLMWLFVFAPLGMIFWYSFCPNHLDRPGGITVHAQRIGIDRDAFTLRSSQLVLGDRDRLLCCLGRT